MFLPVRSCSAEQYSLYIRHMLCDFAGRLSFSLGPVHAHEEERRLGQAPGSADVDFRSVQFLM
jgi:hypothetical protein